MSTDENDEAEVIQQTSVRMQSQSQMDILTQSKHRQQSPKQGHHSSRSLQRPFTNRFSDEEEEDDDEAGYRENEEHILNIHSSGSGSANHRGGAPGGGGSGYRPGRRFRSGGSKPNARMVMNEYISGDEEDFIDAKDPNKSHQFWTTKHQFAQIYNVIKELEKFGTGICVPEFVFIGLQSAGKTSAVSQAARLPVGIMKDGTGSRCPTRFKLKNNPDRKHPYICVNGTPVQNEEAMISFALEHMRALDQKGEFSDKILEIRIESATAPELTFVDLPGLITSKEQKFRHARAQIEKITAKFLNKKKNGFAQYMPILVRVAQEKDQNQNEAKTIVDRIVRQYPGAHHGFVRKDWMRDALHLVNKFDKMFNRSTAREIMECMDKVSEYGNTVITSLNPNCLPTAKMTYGELSQFVGGVEQMEQRKWLEVFQRYASDENLPKLKSKCLRSCGVRKMNEVITNKMCEIVQRILPDIERNLHDTETRKNLELREIAEQIKNCNPLRLKQSVTKFNNRFLNYLSGFYAGNLSTELIIHRKTWKDERNDFRASNYFHDVEATDWFKKGYERTPDVLISLLRSTESVVGGGGRGGGNDNRLNKQRITDINMKLVGGPALKRIIDVWSNLVAYMSFPFYTNEDISCMKNNFMDTKQSSMWSPIESIVLDSVKYFKQSCCWLTQFLRYRLKADAQIVFDYTMEKEFGIVNNRENQSKNSRYNGIIDLVQQQRQQKLNQQQLRQKLNKMKRQSLAKNQNQQRRKPNTNTNTSMSMSNNNGDGDDDEKRSSPENGDGNNNNNNGNGNINTSLDNELSMTIDSPMRRFLERILESYKKEIDQILDEFLATAEVVPGDHGQILDKMYYESNINLGKYTDIILRQYKTLLTLSNSPRLKRFIYKKVMGYKNREVDRSHRIPVDLLAPDGDDNDDEVKMDDVRDNHNHHGVSVVEERPQPTIMPEPEPEPEEPDFDFVPENQGENHMGTHNNNDILNDNDDDNNSGGGGGYTDDELEDENRRGMYGNNGMIPYANQMRAERAQTTADVKYFNYVHGRRVNHPIFFDTMSFDYDVVRAIAEAYWVGIKHFVCRDIEQKFNNHVMAPIKRSKVTDDRIANAIHTGTERRKFDECMAALMNLTGISRADMTTFVEEHAKIVIPKDIAQMEDNEIAKVYGVDRDRLCALQNQKLEELRLFKILMKETLEKIAHIKQPISSISTEI